MGKIKVLWFEVTAPSKYYCGGNVIAGWQDSLERIVRGLSNVELCIAFESNSASDEQKNIEGVEYIPMSVSLSLFDKIKDKWTWEVKASKLEDVMKKIVSDVNPDIIHVFGAEWPYGRIAKYTQKPVVVHIMGFLGPCCSVLYPHGYSLLDDLRNVPFWNLKSKFSKILNFRKYKTWEASESQVWKHVEYYMGRTSWDKALSSIFHPNRKYYHVEEALRDAFVFSKETWKFESKGKVRLFTVGCSPFWKGPDVLLKTAKILKELGFDFEWIVAGGMDQDVKRIVERNIASTYESNNVRLVGFITQQEVVKYICSSTLYVHTSYADNSPNAICEAQYLGIPVVSTNVGGIPSLLKNGEIGELVPPNDPWQMAYVIMNLVKDESKMRVFSEKSKEVARDRHNDKKIGEQLMVCYNDILKR